MDVKRGSVIVVVHGELGRPRPAVVVQTDELTSLTTTLLVCPITSRLTEHLPIRPTVEAKAENGLRVRSQVMTDKMLAIPREHIRMVIGRFDSVTLGRLDTALMVVLGLAG
jgi:mRNA interferase MazF